MCCSDCLVPREFKNKEILIIKTSEEKRNRLQTSCLTIISLDRKKEKEIKIYEKDKIKVKLKNGQKFKGGVTFIESDSIQIESRTVALADISTVSIGEPVTHITGTSIGASFVILGIGELIANGTEYFIYPVLAGLPWFGLNAVRKIYRSKNWKFTITGLSEEDGFPEIERMQ